jgi:hypothetical protein
VTDEEYEEAKKQFEAMCKTMRDYLVLYNNDDVGPFLSGVQHMYDTFREMGVDMFKHNALSLPGLAAKNMWNKLPKDVFIPLWHTSDKDWFYKVRCCDSVV